MQNNILKNLGKFLLVVIFALNAGGANASDDQTLGEEMSADAIASYDIDGSLFQKITDLEQDKVLMQLEKERAQLDLELDRLAADKIKLHMEIDTLEGRAEEQQQALISERERLDADAKKLEKERNSSSSSSSDAAPKKKSAPAAEDVQTEIGNKYRLVDIIGAGNQLQATIEDLNNGQRKKISVGRNIDGYNIKSISLDEGVVFTKDGETETLNIGKSK